MVLKVISISRKISHLGLEWPVVFIPGVAMGNLPNAKTTDIDEERRLLYVGMTRAQALLYLSYHKESPYEKNGIGSNLCI
jgi:DNA helicase II / ATP-dependent DNA helicase PcrA